MHAYVHQWVSKISAVRWEPVHSPLSGVAFIGLSYDYDIDRSKNHFLLQPEVVEARFRSLTQLYTSLHTPKN